MGWHIPKHRNHNAPLGLRRICGTCRHFTGTIRGPGDCTRFVERTHGLTGARDCAEWSRPDPVAVLPPRAAPSRAVYDLPKSTPQAAQRETRVNDIRACAEAGMSMGGTAKRLGIKPGSIRHYAEYYKITFPGKGGCQETQRRNDDIRASLSEGKAITEIAAAFGVTRNAVSQVKRRMK